MTDHETRIANQFSDWLDATAGLSTPDPGGDADPDLTDLRAAAGQFHGLDQRLTDYAVAVLSPAKSWEDVMQSQAPVAQRAPSWLGTPVSRERTARSSPVWLRAANVLLAAGLIVTLIAGAWRASDTLWPGNEGPGGESIPYRGAAPGATPTGRQDRAVSYLPPEACDVEPLTRDEVIADLEDAWEAAPADRPQYDQPQAVDPTQAAAIMDTFGLWDACSRGDRPYAVVMRFQSPEFTRMVLDMSIVVQEFDDESVSVLADLVLARSEEERQAIMDENPEVVRWATANLSTPEATVTADQPEGTPDGSFYGWYPAIVVDRIALTGPETAYAPIRLYDPVSGSLFAGYATDRVDFVLIDGVWLIDAIGPWETDGGTPVADATPSVSYLPPAACTVEPVTRDEVIAHLEQAAIATAADSPRYDQPQTPDATLINAIMETFGMREACIRQGGPLAQVLPFHSLFFIRTAFEIDTLQPEAMPIFVDWLMAENEARRQAIAAEHADLLAANSGDESGTPIPEASPAAVPDDAWYGRYPTIVADEIVLTGPETASAPVRQYDPVARSIYDGPAIFQVDFVLIDGVWLVDALEPWTGE